MPTLAHAVVGERPYEPLPPLIAAVAGPTDGEAYAERCSQHGQG